MCYNEKKLQELVLYVAMQTQDDRFFGATKINKVLFFADFYAYQQHGKSITGAEYQALEFGPAPRRMEPVLNDLVDSGAAAQQQIRVDYDDYTVKKIFTLRKPNLSLFTAEEIHLVGEWIERVRGLTARDVSEMSHTAVGWRLASIGETIPYFSTCLPFTPRQLRPSELAYGKKVLARLQ